MTSHIWKTLETPQAHKYGRPPGPRRLNFEEWILSMELALCHPSGAKNLVVALRFLDNLCPPAVHSCQKDGCNEVFPKFNRDHRVTDFMTCKCVCVTVNIPSVAKFKCNAISVLRITYRFCSKVLYLQMRGSTCYELRYSITRQLYLIPSNMQQNPSTEATSVSASQ